ncbi:helix-turn-helix domain-containing protein [Mucilaginibacter sp.]
MSTDTRTVHLSTISELHKAIGIAKPNHPLFSIIRFENLSHLQNNQRTKIITDFYQITLKAECPCKMQYGQSEFDFDEGVISCFAPKQVSIIDADSAIAKSGWLLSIHPDFLRAYKLNQKIKDYHYFDYAINEALILSEEEQNTVQVIFEQIEKEYQLQIDVFSQDLIIAHIDVLLSYLNRYYNRQFITRRVKYSNLLMNFEEALKTISGNTGIPSAVAIAQQLNLSPKYLSDCLKQLTGLTTKQLMHEKLIESAKDLLSGTQLSISEIAYRLGFEYSQSFNKLFKTKTSKTPMEYRQLFN